ncbi:hypothetical protein Tco_0587554 [Tanacetum coccineum]
MDDPNMTMEEYIKLEEEKARRRGRVFNWETATYGKIRVDDDLHALRSVEAEFPAIVIDDAFALQNAFPCKSQVNTPINDEIDFRISFDESDDEDYAINCNKNLFSYKMISVNNLKTDSENDNEKTGIPSFPPPKPTTSYVDDLDFFKDFENEFTAIVYNDALICTDKAKITRKRLKPGKHEHRNRRASKKSQEEAIKSKTSPSFLIGQYLQRESDVDCEETHKDARFYTRACLKQAQGVTSRIATLAIRVSYDLIQRP